MARLRWLSRQERLVLAGLVGAILLLLVLLLRQWLVPPPPAPVWSGVVPEETRGLASREIPAAAKGATEQEGTGPGAGGVPAGAGVPAGTGPSVQAAPVVVHVAGAVTRPGVFTLREGQRVVDAVEAAGGAAPDARLDWLNLAELLYDGQKIYVPAEDDAGAPAYGGPGGGQGTAAAPPPIDLNRASQGALESLPGIGPALAREILAYRERNPFQSVDDLLKVSGIGPKTLERLRPYVMVR